jgi:hypothetical protein
VARAISLLERGEIVARLGFGMLVNEPVVRMFDTCIRARFDAAAYGGGS